MQMRAKEMTKYPTTNQRVEQTSVPIAIGLTRLSRLEWGIIILGLLFILSLISFNLVIQHKNNAIEYEINQYQKSIGELDMSSELLMNEIMEQYHYPTIKRVAEEAEMSIDPSRIKDFTSE